MKALFCFLVPVLFVSCEKEEADPGPAKPTATTRDAVNVLKDNSGFSAVFDHVQLLAGDGAFVPGLEMFDFTLESNSNLNLSFFDYQYQNETNHRLTWNIETDKEVELPEQADTLGFNTRDLGQKGWIVKFHQFRPYSNFYTYGVEHLEHAWPYARTLEFRGDITGKITKTANPIGEPDMGWRFPCMYPVSIANDNAFGYFMQGLPNPTYQLSECLQSSIAFFTPKAIVTSFLESDLYTYGSYKSFHLRTDSLIAYDYYYNTTTLEAKLTQITRVAVSGIAPTGTYKIKRHYSTDGKVMGMLVRNTNTAKFWTFSYNFDTETLSKGLQDVALDFSGDGTDYDLDEFGNVFYSGYASNGGNTEGVSIYKMNLDGAVTLVGKDNFLKFGQIIMLKMLMGNVYVVVTGKQTGTMYHQLSVLKED